MSDEPSKIIVDDDWKAQVEKEKQMAAQPAAAAPPADVPPAGDQQAAGEQAAEMDYPPAPPDASFETLVTMLFTQGMAALGQLPGDDDRPMPINKPFAKHFIDTLEMLGEKTKGNLSEAEAGMLGEVLHAMRMTFVSVKSADKGSK